MKLHKSRTKTCQNFQANNILKKQKPPKNYILIRGFLCKNPWRGCAAFPAKGLSPVLSKSLAIYVSNLANFLLRATFMPE